MIFHSQVSLPEGEAMLISSEVWVLLVQIWRSKGPSRPRFLQGIAEGSGTNSGRSRGFSSCSEGSTHRKRRPKLWWSDYLLNLLGLGWIARQIFCHKWGYYRTIGICIFRWERERKRKRKTKRDRFNTHAQPAHMCICVSIYLSIYIYILCKDIYIYIQNQQMTICWA